MVPSIREHIAELDEQRDGLCALDAPQLDIEQLLHHRRLAELPVHGARPLESLEQRRAQLVGLLEMLQGPHAVEEPLFEDAAEAEEQRRLPRRVALGGDGLFELFDERVPIVNGFENRQPLRKIHGSLGLRPSRRVSLLGVGRPHPRGGQGSMVALPGPARGNASASPLAGRSLRCVVLREERCGVVALLRESGGDLALAADGEPLGFSIAFWIWFVCAYTTPRL
ncbi:MAG: hypothetical protein IPM79_29750 [Polyangiaceae bacterium]|nr:hypothetical protein [Polyangiaceae bacterium]